MAVKKRDDVIYPERCQHCNGTMEAPVACQNCHALYPEAVSLDHFKLFRLPRAFSIDPQELHRKFLLISRGVHPDFFGTGSEETASLALNLSAEVNEAYETLKDPLRRAEYMLSLAGGKSSAQDKSVPESLLGEVFMLQEEIEEANANNDQNTLAMLKRQLADRRESMLAEIGQLADSLIQDESEALDALRKQINGAKYIEGLLAKLR